MRRICSIYQFVRNPFWLCLESLDDNGMILISDRDGNAIRYLHQKAGWIPF